MDSNIKPGKKRGRKPKKDKQSITLEPGGQLELSGEPLENRMAPAQTKAPFVTWSGPEAYDDRD